MMQITIDFPNATNGEVYEAMFPDADVQIWEHDHKVRVEHKIGLAFWIDLSWWNAPYKGGEE